MPIVSGASATMVVAAQIRSACRTPPSSRMAPPAAIPRTTNTRSVRRAVIGPDDRWAGASAVRAG
jgi:hypothetical protein